MSREVGEYKDYIASQGFPNEWQSEQREMKQERSF